MARLLLASSQLNRPSASLSNLSSSLPITYSHSHPTPPLHHTTHTHTHTHIPYTHTPHHTHARAHTHPKYTHILYTYTHTHIPYTHTPYHTHTHTHTLPPLFLPSCVPLPPGAPAGSERKARDMVTALGSSGRVNPAVARGHLHSAGWTPISPQIHDAVPSTSRNVKLVKG